MTKHTKTIAGEDSAARLEDIARMQLGALSDDAVLGLLAERRQLFEMQREYAARQKAAEERAALETKKREAQKAVQKKKAETAEALKALNRSISPEKDDEELLMLIAKRKALEKQLADLTAEDSRSDQAAMTEDVRTQPVDTAAEAVSVVEQDIRTVPVSLAPEMVQPPTEAFGRDVISPDDFNEGSTFHRYLEQLQNNTGSLGTLLQEMPLDAKKNKAFMLKVADIDPAYAMHYADQDTLKRDEDFNIRIASLKNPRHSGNAVAEMLPEARTSKVILAAVKQDYLNIKFVRPDMAEYDEMIKIAKKAALERVKDLKEAADIMLLIPRPLQQDTQFMQDIERITASLRGEKTAV